MSSKIKVGRSYHQGTKDGSIRELPNPDNYMWKDYVGVHGTSKDPTEDGTLYLLPLDAKDCSIHTIQTIGTRYTLAPNRRLPPSGQTIEDAYSPKDWISLFVEKYQIYSLNCGMGIRVRY